MSIYQLLPSIAAGAATFPFTGTTLAAGATATLSTAVFLGAEKYVSNFSNTVGTKVKNVTSSDWAGAATATASFILANAALLFGAAFVAKTALPIAALSMTGAAVASTVGTVVKLVLNYFTTEKASAKGQMQDTTVEQNKNNPRVSDYDDEDTARAHHSQSQYVINVDATSPLDESQPS